MKVLLRHLSLAATLVILSEPATAQDRSSYGLVTSGQFLENGEIGLQKMQELGNGSVRIGIDWIEVQPQQNGSFQWDRIDHRLENARNAGMEIYVNLGKPPAWAAPCPNICAPWTDQMGNGWYWYVRNVIERYYPMYGNAITFGVWNEPDLRDFLRSTPDDPNDPSPWLYYTIAAFALYARNDSGLPARFALMDTTPGAWNTGWFQLVWGTLRDDGTLRPQDIASTHWYPGQANPTLLAQALHNYTGREVWITETGPLTPTGDFDQTSFLTEWLDYFQSSQRPSYLTRFFYYRLWDGEYWAEALLRPDWTNRPGFDLYKSRIPGGGGGGGPVFAGSFSFRASNGRFVCAEGNGNSIVNANRDNASTWETFSIRDLNGGSLQSGDAINIETGDGWYFSAVDEGGSTLNTYAQQAITWEQFYIIRLAGPGEIQNGDQIAIQTLNGHYLVAEGGGGDIVNANRTAVGPWETFTVIRY